MHMYIELLILKRAFEYTTTWGTLGMLNEAGNRDSNFCDLFDAQLWRSAFADQSSFNLLFDDYHIWYACQWVDVDNKESVLIQHNCGYV